MTVGDKSFPAASHLPVLVYPNPIAPSRYVVLNSGLTIAENSYTSDYSMPTLGDIAVLQVQPELGNVHVPFAGFFDESWRLQVNSPRNSEPELVCAFAALHRDACFALCAVTFVSASAQMRPFTPPPIVRGGQVVPLYPPGSPFLNAARVGEPEQNNMAKGVPGRIQSIVNVHNPSIEFHPADPGINTGVAMIVIPAGGHNTLVVGTEGADVVHYLFNYGVNSIILRNRLRRDGYNAQTDAVYDAQQAIRLVRSRAAEWGIDPKKIGVIGFSAGAELAAPAAVFYEQFEKTNGGAGDPLAGVSARPDFAILIYPGPTPYTRDAATAVPKNTPPTFIATAGSGDANHAVWAMEYFSAMLDGAHSQRRDARLRQRHAR